jgi:uncharacterized protein
LSSSPLTLITGATSGLGRELSFLLAKKKHPLFLTGKCQKKLFLLQKELSTLTAVEVATLDLANDEDLKHLLKSIREKKPSLVINSAGCALAGSALSFPLEDSINILKTNVEALVSISIEAARVLKEANQKGIIVNISSVAASFVYPSFALYAASKSFVSSFSQSLDREVAKDGIRILTAVPGQFDSFFREKAHKQRTFPPRKTSWNVLSLQKTAQKILWQIEKKKAYMVIGALYKILLAISHLIPKRILARYLEKKNMQQFL